MTERYHVVRIGAVTASLNLGPQALDIEQTLSYDQAQAAPLGLTYSYRPCTTEEQTTQALRDAHIVLTPGRRISRRSIEAAADLKLIACLTVGFDYVDHAAASERGIPVVNVPLYCVDDVADHTMALLLACARKIRLLDHGLRSGYWGFSRMVPTPGLKEQVLGILGIGNIGRRVAERARPFGLHVLACDPYLTQESVSRFGATLVSLDELLARSDYFSCHTPLNDETRHLMGERQFRSMKPTAYLINTSRGPVVDEQALIRALEGGWIAGAAIDVFETEPIPPDSLLLRMENVIITPHAAAYSEASARNVRAMAWDEVRRFVRGECLTSVVNPAVRERVALAP